MDKSSSGFTIVELLVVIVVLVILATIVALNVGGVLLKAENAKIISSAESLKKSLAMVYQNNRSYPVGDRCLGSIDMYPATAQSDAGSCWRRSSVSTDPGFMSQLSAHLSPDISFPVKGISYESIRGIMYRGNHQSYSISMIISGYRTPCPSGWEGSVQSGDLNTRMCTFKHSEATSG